MARKFLYVVAALVVLTGAGLFAYRMFGAQLLRNALVPSASFIASESRLDYSRPDLWFSRPGKADDPARWTPAGYHPATHAPVAVFFIHPTSYIDRSRWNAPLDDPAANDRARLFLRGQASAFNEVGEVWAPRYRQATFGAFLTSRADAEKALDSAYQDVLAAFDRFVAEAGPTRPIILAGHSQGALHLTRLLKDRIAGRPIAGRVIAAYVVGWPVSRTADLPALGLPECSAADQTGCILSWQSFAEPADPSLITDTFDASNGYAGVPRRGTPLICTNPLTGTPNAAAPASANFGTLVPSADLRSATLVPGRVGARCDGRGFLLIGSSPPDMGPYVLPGNNYHVFDYSLFWANVRTDAGRRLSAYLHDRQPMAAAR